jgi:hypothetical protein
MVSTKRALFEGTVLTAPYSQYIGPELGSGREANLPLPCSMDPTIQVLPLRI